MLLFFLCSSLHSTHHIQNPLNPLPSPTYCLPLNQPNVSPVLCGPRSIDPYHLALRHDGKSPKLSRHTESQSHRSKHLSLTVTGQQFLLHFSNFLCFFPIPISLKSSENLLFFFFFPNVPGTFSPFLAPFSLCSRASRQQQIRLRIRSLGKPTWFRL